MAGIDKDAAIAVGYRISGASLLEQAAWTRALVMSDLPGMKAAGQVSDADLAEVDNAVAAVHKGVQDYTLAASEAHAQSAELSISIHNLKSARRNLMNSVERVFRHRPEFAGFRQGTYHGTNVAALCVDLSRKIAFAKEHAVDLAPVGISDDFLVKFEAQVHAVELSSGQQDLKLATLPERTRSFCEAKGWLYFLLRNLNNAGRAYYCDDSELAARYNLKLLYRRGRNKPEPPAGPTPVVAK
jgi:hypothetical protein